MDPRASTSYYYPVPAPPLELPASQQTRFPTLQRAGAFLKQAQSPLAYGNTYTAADGVRRSLTLGGAASPTSPSSVAVSSSFLASIRRGLDDLAHGAANDEDDEDENEDDDDDDSPRYYAGNSENTYYSPPSAFEAFGAPSSRFHPLPLPLPLPSSAAALRTSRSDEDLIFDLEM
ncbi:hypothetical protein PybrP1_010323 [[Pythium] brassicae (nom. inval.)]|nr:hypothetical protein PybrP1_010323 [[Pythium] brassicae (nom. inval.)]